MSRSELNRRPCGAAPVEIKKKHPTAAGCAALALAAGLAWLAVPVLARADAAAGHRLARRWCASCHVIGNGAGQTVPQGPPTFRSIARGDMSPAAIRAFLTKPHGKMPDLSLTRSEIENLTDYIESLR